MNKKSLILVILTISCLCITINSVSAADCSTSNVCLDSNLDSNIYSTVSTGNSCTVNILDSNMISDSDCDILGSGVIGNTNINTNANTYAMNLSESNSVSKLSSTNVSDNSSLTNNCTIYFNANAISDGNGTIDNPYKYFSFSKLNSNNTAYFYKGVYHLTDDDLDSKDVTSVTLSGEDASGVILEYNGSNNAPLFKDYTVNNITFKGLYILAVSSFNGTNLIFRDCSSYRYNVTGFSYGIIFFVNEGNLILNNCSFINNTADFGGVINLESAVGDINVFIDDCKFINNNATYGGVIRSEGGENVAMNIFISNSEFINNTAKYSGAIYLGKNVTGIIKGSKFSNNSASNFGGSISTSYGSLDISDCVFENSCSKSGAGGAIYLIQSEAKFNNIYFNNSYSKFGGSICSLASNSTISNCKFRNSVSIYAGGAIYGEYMTITILSSEFSNCSSSRGGALFMDSCANVKLLNSNFTDNNASSGYDIFFNEITKSINMNNLFINNSVIVHNTIYNQSEFDFPFFDNNYVVIINNYTLINNFSSKYDLRTEGFVTPVKNQNSGEDCWAFSAIAALESAILKATNGTQTYILSDDNLKNIMRIYSDYGWPMDFNRGGVPALVMGYLSSWLGPISEEYDEYYDLSVLSPVLKPLLHIQNIICADLDENGYATKDSLKYLITNYGAVSTVYYHNSTFYNPDTYGYYYNGNSSLNHAVAIVGWDDNYSKNNFNITPPGDGAWIIKNSWGTSFGDGGYFYISYYDTSFSHALGGDLHNYVFVFNESINYTGNYQYDLGKTDWVLTANNTVWYKNIFTAKNNDLLAAFSTYVKAKTNYTAYIYLNDELVLSQSGYIKDAGYHTIHLKDLISLKTGDNFTIALKVNTQGNVCVPVFNREYFVRNYTFGDVSFISYDGVNWINLNNATNLTSITGPINGPVLSCIKAFTISNSSSNPTINITVNDVFYKEEAVINIHTDSNLTEIYIVVNDEEFVLPLDNGLATLNLANLTVGTYNVVAKLNTTPCVLAFTKFNVKPNVCMDAIINDNHGEDGYVNVVLFDKNVNALTGTVIVKINNVNYTVDVVDGVGVLKLNLPTGHYTANVVFEGNENYSSVETNVTFNVIAKKATVIDASNLNTTVYIQGIDNKSATTHSGVWLNMTLKDSNGKLLANKSIKLSINGVNYILTTDKKGVARFEINLKNKGTYSYAISFAGDENYNSSLKTVKVTVKPKTTKLTISNKKYKLNSKSKTLTALFKTKNNKVIANKKIYFKVNGVCYIAKTNSKGLAKVKVSLTSKKTYTYAASFLGDNQYGKTISKGKVTIY